MSEVNDPLLPLLLETASGEKDAFRLLYDASSAKLFGVLLRILKRQDLAEDVLQEVYLTIWHKAELYNPTMGRPISWMVAIARNKAIDLLRQAEEKTVQLSLSDQNGDDLSRMLVEQSSLALDPPERMTLAHCLEEVEPKSRECVLLAYQYGLSRDELSERFNVPSSTIKSWLRRALIGLKQCLER